MLKSPTANRNRFNSLFKPFVKHKSEDDINSNNVTENGRPRSVFASLSTESRAEKKAELLDLMVAQGKITKDDRLDLLKKYGTAENYRAGDTQRKILAFLVKTSKISIDDAVHYSRLLELSAQQRQRREQLLR
ncbi:hypothetical protein BSL78_18595 [Apostichopus japonicus]|uniref:Uncharacterized protein n=1 Tax=Stichopus japonicus TaxID=307972 RepID=A0A2G8K9A7_STIJA|nr:hypothetical protein BSL78_18595 [Apostichopus japonicus]